QSASQIASIREAVPSIGRVVVYCRNEERLETFCREHGCEPAEAHREAAEHDVVGTVTTAKDPVLRGEWLRQGALVCAVGANDPRRRELDNAVLERAAFVCCDSREDSSKESGDLIEPVAQGVLDWLEVHELHEVVAGQVHGRASDDDIVVFKSNGIAAWDLAAGARVVGLARARGVGLDLWPVQGGDVVAERVHDLGSFENAPHLIVRAAVLHVGIVEDVVQRAAAAVLTDDVFGDELLALRALEEKREGTPENVANARHGSSLLFVYSKP